jgi:hypothetical protein
MPQVDDVINLLIDPQTGGILHVSCSTEDFYGYAVPQLKSMNASEIFTVPVEEIVGKVRSSEYLKVISLGVRLATGLTCDAKAYASFVASGKSETLFLSIFEISGRVARRNRPATRRL